MASSSRLAGPRTSDAQFLAFLEAMAGIVISSNRGVYLTLSVQSLHTLLGAAEFDRRWARILGKNLSPELMARRAKVASMIAESKNW